MGADSCSGIRPAGGAVCARIPRCFRRRLVQYCANRHSMKSLERMASMRIWMVAGSLVLVFASQAPQSQEAPTGFDDKSNGLVDDATYQADQVKFDEVEGVADGLGPLYNAQSCGECHQNPTSGGASQITELRVGHLGPDGRFHNPDIPIARGTEIISGRTLVNDRAICPNAAFPDSEIQERVPDTETIRTTRAALNLLGD